MVAERLLPKGIPTFPDLGPIGHEPEHDHKPLRDRLVDDPQPDPLSNLASSPEAQYSPTWFPSTNALNDGFLMPPNTRGFHFSTLTECTSELPTEIPYRRRSPISNRRLSRSTSTPSTLKRVSARPWFQVKPTWCFSESPTSNSNSRSFLVMLRILGTVGHGCSPRGCVVQADQSTLRVTIDRRHAPGGRGVRPGGWAP